MAQARANGGSISINRPSVRPTTAVGQTQTAKNTGWPMKCVQRIYASLARLTPFELHTHFYRALFSYGIALIDARTVNERYRLQAVAKWALSEYLSTQR
jgi:hypothetical protein